LVGRLHRGQALGVVGVRAQHGGVLVAEQELDLPVLEALEAAARAQVGAQRAVLGRCHGGQHIPGVHQLLHDAADARQHLEGLGQAVGGHALVGGLQLVQRQLHPQLAGLVLDDEEHLVVRRREWLLRRQDGVELQVVAIAHRGAEVELRAVVVAGEVVWTHQVTLPFCWKRASRHWPLRSRSSSWVNGVTTSTKRV
jgi:hypothetical protein